jgi:hypothetical protein
MARLAHHTRSIILAIGVASCLSAWAWSGVAVDDSMATLPSVQELGGITLLLCFQLSPFVALAAASRRLTRWGSLAAAVVFGGLLLEAQREVIDSTSSTAVILIFFAPLILLMAVPILAAAAQVVRLVRLRLAGGRIPRPGWWQIVLTLAAAALGFLLLSVAGVLAGLALRFAVWAAGVERGDESL